VSGLPNNENMMEDRRNGVVGKKDKCHGTQGHSNFFSGMEETAIFYNGIQGKASSKKHHLNDNREADTPSSSLVLLSPTLPHIHPTSVMSD
jgi:hypothetical protein